MDRAEQKELAWMVKQAGLTAEEALLFGEYLHDCKEGGIRGTKNSMGDFTRAELQERMDEFLETIR